MHTVRSWLKPDTARAHFRPPDMAVELLYLKLKLRVPPDLDMDREQ